MILAWNQVQNINDEIYINPDKKETALSVRNSPHFLNDHIVSD